MNNEAGGNDLEALKDVLSVFTDDTKIDTKIDTKTDTKVDTKTDTKKNSGFSIPIIIAAALIFIVIIAWFESLRVWLEFAFNTSTPGLFNKALADMVYAISATVIAILVIFLIMKFWIKNI